MAGTRAQQIGAQGRDIALLRPTPSRWAIPLRFARRKPVGAFAALVIIVLLVMGLFGEIVAPYAYDDYNIPDRLHGPSLSHPFGTDIQGRDVFSRVIFGARTSILIGFGTVAIAATAASTIGTTSGYFGGWFDLLFQRLVDVIQGLPGLIFIIFVVSIVGAGTMTIILALGVLFAAGSSRVVRAQVISVKQNDYIVAARSIGASNPRILLRHIYPNVFAVVIVSISVQVGFVILIESTLSFLGLGIPPPVPSWGRMLQDAQVEMTRHPYLAVFPGLAIGLTVYAFNMFGDALRDVLDPRLRGSG